MRVSRGRCLFRIAWKNLIFFHDFPHILLATSLEYLEIWANHLKLYTDGSKCEIKTDCAFFVLTLNVGKSRRVPNKTSIFYAELGAILHTLQWLGDRPPFQTVILLDSLSALQALEVEGGVPLVQ